MIDYLPQLDGEGKAHPKSWRNGMIEPKMLKGYPRIEDAFTVDEPCDLGSRGERDELIEHLGGKVQKRSKLWRRFFEGGHVLVKTRSAPLLWPEPRIRGRLLTGTESSLE